MILNDLTFSELKDFKYQLVLKTDTSDYFFSKGKEIHYGGGSALAFNERTGELEIVPFSSVISIICDGKTIEVSKPLSFLEKIKKFLRLK